MEIVCGMNDGHWLAAPLFENSQNTVMLMAPLFENNQSTDVDCTSIWQLLSKYWDVDGTIIWQLLSQYGDVDIIAANIICCHMCAIPAMRANKSRYLLGICRSWNISHRVNCDEVFPPEVYAWLHHRQNEWSLPVQQVVLNRYALNWVDRLRGEAATPRQIWDGGT